MNVLFYWHNNTEGINFEDKNDLKNNMLHVFSQETEASMKMHQEIKVWFVIFHALTQLVLFSVPSSFSFSALVQLACQRLLPAKL